MTESTFSQMFEIPMLGHEELQISCAVNGQWSRGATLYHDGEQLDPRELRATADADVPQALDFSHKLSVISLDLLCFAERGVVVCTRSAVVTKGGPICEGDVSSAACSAGGCVASSPKLEKVRIGLEQSWTSKNKHNRSVFAAMLHCSPKGARLSHSAV